jgi:colanic acid biosynthesis glycosyl transferase WcaI
VTVVTGVPHYPQWKRAPFDPSGAFLENPTVLRYKHFVPTRAHALGRCLYEVTWLLSAGRALPTAKSDVAIGIVPSLSGAVLAWLIGRRQRIPFGIIFQDLMGSAALQSGYTGGKRLAWLASRIELAVARRAARVAIVAEGFRPYLERGGVPTSRIFRVRNWGGAFAPTITPGEARSKLGWPQDAFICLHAGNMGQKQALDNLLETARLLEGKGITIVLAGDGNDRARLIAKARDVRLSNVQFIGVQPSGIYEAMLEAADVLLLNQRRSVSDMALPSKLASYFAAGKPVVAAVATESESARQVSDAGGTVVVAGSPRKLADALLLIKVDIGMRTNMGAAARDYFDRHLDYCSALKRYDDFLVGLGGLARIAAPEPVEMM